MRPGWLRTFALLVSLLLSTAALACPDCPTSQVVRASVVGEDFWNRLVMVAVPFLLLGSLSAFMYRVGLPPRDAAPARTRKVPERAA